MTPERAAEVLRGVPAFERFIKQVPLSQTAQACEMGADALELLGWMFDMDGNDIMRFHALERQWCQSGSIDSFLDYCRAEWEKERKG